MQPARPPGLQTAIKPPRRYTRQDLARRAGEAMAGRGLEADAGTWVRIFTPPTESRLVGRLPALRVGPTVRVRLSATNVERGFIDLALLPA